MFIAGLKVAFGHVSGQPLCGARSGSVKNFGCSSLARLHGTLHVADPGRGRFCAGLMQSSDGGP